MLRDSLCQCIIGFHVTAKLCPTEFPYVICIPSVRLQVPSPKAKPGSLFKINSDTPYLFGFHSYLVTGLRNCKIPQTLLACRLIASSCRQGYTEHTPSSSLHLWGGTGNLWQDVIWSDVVDKCCVTQKHPLQGVTSGGWYRYQTLSAGNSFALAPDWGVLGTV